MNEAQGPCSVCGAGLRRETTTVTQTIGDNLYIVTDVPAEVCVQRRRRPGRRRAARADPAPVIPV